MLLMPEKLNLELRGQTLIITSINTTHAEDRKIAQEIFERDYFPREVFLSKGIIEGAATPRVNANVLGKFFEKLILTLDLVSKENRQLQRMVTTFINNLMIVDLKNGQTIEKALKGIKGLLTHFAIKQKQVGDPRSIHLQPEIFLAQTPVDQQMPDLIRSFLLLNKTPKFSIVEKGIRGFSLENPNSLLKLCEKKILSKEMILIIYYNLFKFCFLKFRKTDEKPYLLTKTLVSLMPENLNLELINNELTVSVTLFQNKKEQAYHKSEEYFSQNYFSGEKNFKIGILSNTYYKFNAIVLGKFIQNLLIVSELNDLQNDVKLKELMLEMLHPDAKIRISIEDALDKLSNY